MSKILDDNNAGNWAIVELMGHKVVAGFVTKSEMLGKPLLRVDVPATEGYAEFSQFYGEASIYCVTFVSEEVARLTANQVKLNPVSVYTPDLITREQVDKMEANYRKAISLYEREIERVDDDDLRPDDDE